MGGGLKIAKIRNLVLAPKIVPKGPIGVGIGPFGKKNHEESESGAQKSTKSGKNRKIYILFKIFGNSSPPSVHPPIAAPPSPWGASWALSMAGTCGTPVETICMQRPARTSTPLGTHRPRAAPPGEGRAFGGVRGESLKCTPTASVNWVVRPRPPRTPAWARRVPGASGRRHRPRSRAGCARSCAR